MVIVLLVTKDNLEDIIDMSKIKSEDKILSENMNKCILIATSPTILRKLQGFPNVVTQYHERDNSTQPCRGYTRHHPLVDVITTLSQLKLRIVTLPFPQLLRIPVSFPVSSNHHVLAGRVAGQTSPSIDHLWLEDQFPVFQLFAEIARRGIETRQDTMVEYLRHPHMAVTWAWKTLDYP